MPISTEEDLVAYSRSQYRRPVCADTRVMPVKVDDYKSTRAEAKARPQLLANKAKGTLIPKGALFLKEPLPL